MLEYLLDKLVALSSRASKILAAAEKAAKWSTKYINDLPDEAFAVIEKGYEEGKDKRARHLPHHIKDVKKSTEDSSVDLPHYRNALARADQIKSVLGNETDNELRKRAIEHLEKHSDVLEDD